MNIFLGPPRTPWNSIISVYVLGPPGGFLMLIVWEPLGQKYHVICFGLVISLEKQLQNLKKKKSTKPPELSYLTRKQ